MTLAACKVSKSSTHNWALPVSERLITNTCDGIERSIMRKLEYNNRQAVLEVLNGTSKEADEFVPLDGKIVSLLSVNPNGHINYVEILDEESSINLKGDRRQAVIEAFYAYKFEPIHAASIDQCHKLIFKMSI